jgi:hypothetical protein
MLRWPLTTRVCVEPLHLCAEWVSDLPAHPSHKPSFAGRFSASTTKRLRVSRKSVSQLLTGPADRA